MSPALLAAALLYGFGPAAPRPAEVRVVDAATGRGVPLVELETTHNVRLVTDNAGRAALAEPDLYGRPVWLSVRGHGYEVEPDGFGLRGVRVVPDPGRPAVIEVRRAVPAERVGRLTGAGRRRDSALLGYDVPAPLNGGVLGQDSVQAALYRGKAFWFWGDTRRANYPLGLFRTAGATTPPPAPAGDVLNALRYEYFTGSDGFVRAVAPLPGRPEGVVWVDGVCVVPDAAGTDRLVCHYSRRAGLADQLDHGVAVWDDAAAVFRPVSALPNAETWRHPSTHPVRYKEGGVRYLLFGAPGPNVRVPATLEAVLNPAAYEAFTPVGPDGAPPAPGAPPVWRWQTEFPPAGSREERAWAKAGRLAPADARFLPADAADPADPARRVTLHSGSVGRNAYRDRWVLIAGEIDGRGDDGGPSHLGEVWYAEADAPTGPFGVAVKIASHDRQSFYNVARFPFLDRDGGKTVFFEGTFARDFSGNPEAVPRYEYNQLLYRLDLDAPALRAAR